MLVTTVSIRRVPNPRHRDDCAHRSWCTPIFAGGTSRFQEVIGAEAALLLLEEMKASGTVPDIFTYTTVISGMARAEVSGAAA